MSQFPPNAPPDPPTGSVRGQAPCPRLALRRWALALLTLLACAHAAAQSYQWRDVVQQVEIRPDGSVLVDDTRTLWTDEDFGQAFICLALTRGQRVTLLEGSGAVSSGPPARAFTQRCDGGTELVVEGERRVAERRVRFVYLLEGTVDAYSDVVQWYWEVLEADHPPVRGYQLTVRAPGPMSAPYDAYVHRFGNPEQPRVTLSDDRSALSVAFDRVPSGDGVEIRYLMDPALFTLQGRTPGFERLLEDEARIAGVETGMQARRSPWWALVPLTLFVALAVQLLRVHRRVGREPRVESMRYPFEPPTELPPAAVTAIMQQHFASSSMGPAFHATIMDLMRRGYGVFEPRRGRKVDIRLSTTEPRDDLLPFEADVLRYLRRAAGANEELLTHEKLKRFSEKHASGFLPGWGKRVRDWLLEQRGGELTTEESRREARRWAGIAAVAALVPGALALVLDKDAVALMIVGAVLIGGLAVVALIALPSWRPEIAQEVAEWRGFKRTLTDYTRMKDAPLDFFRLWDVYYAYAAAMGVAQNYLKTLQRAAPLAGADEAAMVRSATWLGATGSHANVSNLAGLSSSISSLSSALSAASASASSGGSVSGGGGGGGGGSSGGR